MLFPSIGAQFFSAPGTINFNMSGSITDANLLSLEFTGSGSQSFDLILTELANGGTPDGFEASGLSGTITYNFTPVATPLPAALPLFATGLGGLGLLGWRRKRKAEAAA